MNRVSLKSCCLVLVLGAAWLQGKDIGAADEPESPADIARRERLAAMTRVIDEATLESAGTSLKVLSRTERPLLRYTNPVTSRFAEGSLFLWMDGKRPMAAVSPSCRDDGTIWWELSSLSTEPLRLTRQGAVIWRPKTCSRPAERLPDAPEPAASPAARLTQLRTLARRFQLREERREAWQDARLLTQPLFRWEDRERGIPDGAIFGFAETTDPEALLLLEARQATGENQPRWWFTIARMTSSPCVMILDEREIWSSGGYWKNPRSQEDPYVEAAVGKIDTALLRR